MMNVDNNNLNVTMLMFIMFVSRNNSTMGVTCGVGSARPFASHPRNLMEIVWLDL